MTDLNIKQLWDILDIGDVVNNPFTTRLTGADQGRREKVLPSA